VRSPFSCCQRTCVRRDGTSVSCQKTDLTSRKLLRKSGIRHIPVAARIAGLIHCARPDRRASLNGMLGAFESEMFS
jgi:hypothetical protein